MAKEKIATASVNESGQEPTEIFVIDKPFLTRPRLYLNLKDSADEKLPLHLQIEILREALRPFAEMGHLFHAPDADKPIFSMNFSSSQTHRLTVNDFRRAQIALAQTSA